MINPLYFFSVLMGLALYYLTFGVLSKTVENYFLRQHKLGIFELACALIASQLSSGMILGIAHTSYEVGLWAILYGLGISLGLVILGFGLAVRMRTMQVATTAEIFKKYYHSSSLTYIASIISIISLWGILLAEIVASKTIFTSIKMTDINVFLGYWIFLIIYSMLGEIKSVMIIEIMQTIFIGFVFSYIFITSMPFSLTELFNTSQLKLVQNYFFDVQKPATAFLPMFFMPTLFALIKQSVAQKFLRAKTDGTAAAASILAAIFLILFACIQVSLGILARAKYVIVEPNTSPLILGLFLVTSKLFFVLVVCALLAAITSVSTALLHAMSSAIIQDFSIKLPFKHEGLITSRVLYGCAGVSALITSFFIKNDIIYILENSFRVSVLCLFVPVSIAYFCKRVHAQAAWCSLICSILTFASMRMLDASTFVQDVSCLLIALIGYSATHMIISWKK